VRVSVGMGVLCLGASALCDEDERRAVTVDGDVRGVMFRFRFWDVLQMCLSKRCWV